MAEIDALGDEIYPTLNNGVYRAGFATAREAYDEAFADVFGTLERWEARLTRGGPFLFGNRVTEANLRVFVTTVRFDAAYHGLFKLNRRRLEDHPRLAAHLRGRAGAAGRRRDRQCRAHQGWLLLGPRGQPERHRARRPRPLRGSSPMPQTEAVVATGSASRYLQQLAKHGSPMFDVTFDAHGADIPLPFGRCLLDADAGSLRLRPVGVEGADMGRFRQAVADHLARFAFRKTLRFD